MSWCCVFLIWTGFKGFSSWLLLFIKEWPFIHLRSNGEKRIKRNLDRWSLVVLATPLTANCDFFPSLSECFIWSSAIGVHSLATHNVWLQYLFFTWTSSLHTYLHRTCHFCVSFHICVGLGWKGSIRRSCKKKKRKEKRATKRFWAVSKSPCPWCNLNLNQKLESDWTK